MHLFATVGQMCPILELVLTACFMSSSHFLLLLSAHAFGQLMVIGLRIIFKYIHSLHSLLFPFPPLHHAHFLQNFHLALLLGPPAELLLGFHAIFDGLADEGVRSGPLDVVDVETPEVVLLLCGGRGVVRVDYPLVGNRGVVADSLEVFLVGGLKKLLPLRQLPQLVVGLAIFEGGIRYVALLIEGIGPVVGRAVELSGHAIKLWSGMHVCVGDNEVAPQRQQNYHMNYNELTFHKANPFYKQDFMPDRAWFNRKAKDFPSEMPSGKEFFTDNGRKHFSNRFNYSEIQNENILKSPQRYPFENRIAMEKTYMRSLHTIDIEGASSNTRVNQSIKNKYKAQDELARRYNQSLDLAKPKVLTEQQRRREVALRQFQQHQERKINRESSNSRTLETSQVSSKSNNPQYPQTLSLKNQLSEEYKRFVMQNSSNKWNKDIPQPRLPERTESSKLSIDQSPNYQTVDPNFRRYNSSNSEERQPEAQRQENNNFEPKEQSYHTSESNKKNGANPAPTPSSHYQYQFNGERLRNNEEYQRIMKYEEMSRQILQNPRDFRKNNPTNLSLSFNLAGQSIVSN